uniref:Uncharacterized protein n=1 Tax=Physcomitrium patens TaxID=3218 RepID=A0A2K1ITU5_PHYPA|nr:hypothetical protein PHYPA_024645 [Physcomitrium patens]
MAPAAAVCSTMVQKQSQEPKQVVSGKRRLTLDSWVSQPSHEAVRASSGSSSGSSCTTQKGSSLDKTLTLVTGDDEACSRVSACVTPKSKKHRIPVVDVDLCPPAPKKPRSIGRIQVVCALKFEISNFYQKLSVSPKYFC